MGRAATCVIEMCGFTLRRELVPGAFLFLAEDRLDIVVQNPHGGELHGEMNSMRDG